MGERSNTSLRGLRTRVERALETGQRGRLVVAQLDTLTREAVPGSEEALFAHRQLAELRLDDSPWRAALHLRQLSLAGVTDDGVHGLMGLCLALMGSFRAAVAAYRRALTLAPNNPWYHHNVGHLLDVALGQSRAAVVHLRRAHELAARERAITDSLANCLMRLGRHGEAQSLMDAASLDAAMASAKNAAPTPRGIAQRAPRVRKNERASKPRRRSPAREDGSKG